MSNRLPRSTPTQLKVSASAIQSFLDEIEHKGLELHSFMLLRDGVVAAEGWWAPYGPEHPHMLFSLSKSFTSTAIGFAESEGLLAVHDRVVSFFPDFVPENPSAHLSQMRIHDLLTMSTGHTQDTVASMEQNLPDHWVKAFLQLPVDHEPGSHFVYNSGATYMLSAIIQQVTGVTLLEYLRSRLFEPLGIKQPTWDSCPRGINAGGWGLNVTTEDIAKFGQLYLQKGMWNGKRLLPEAWVDRATSAQVSNGSDPDSDWAQGYGYQFWRCRHNAYRGDGMFSQYCIVFPEHNVVVAMTSATENMQAVLNAVWDNLLPGFEGASARTGEEDAALADRLRTLSLPLPRFQSSSPLEKSLSGRRYVFETNEENIESITLDFTDNEAAVTVRQKDTEQVIRCGRGEWLFFRSGDQDRKVAAGITWKDDHTVIVSHCLVETPFRVMFEGRFEGDAVQVKITRNVGGPQTLELAGKTT